LGYFIAAPTGIGKTLCFLIPALGLVDLNSKVLQIEEEVSQVRTRMRK
jgi:CRISPR/Cas system-associated endonuclease/helicase Cas3